MWTLALLCVLAMAAGGRTASFPPDVADALRAAQHLYVATKRKDGTESARAPIWFMYDGQAVYFTTGPDTYKAKRIRAGSPLLVWVGTENGPQFVGKAEILDPEAGAAAAAKMAPVYDQKYWISWVGFFRPRPERVRTGKTLIVKVTPLE